MLRPIIEIDEEKCDGCGQCITDCAEGALEIVNGKAKLVSEKYCDGLGACLNCPQGALKLSMKEAPAFDEAAAMEALKAKKPKKPQKAKLNPFTPLSTPPEKKVGAVVPSWPIQLALLPAQAEFLNDARISLCAQCAGFAYPELHKKFVEGHVPIIACPKLEGNAKLVSKLAAALKDKKIESFDLVRMSVPCCKRLQGIVEEAFREAGIHSPIEETIVSLS